jgi:hypothetical protein
MGRMGFSQHFGTKNEHLYYQLVTGIFHTTKDRIEEKLFQIRTAGKNYTWPA